MAGKRVRFMTMMAAAVGIPYVWFNDDVGAPLKSGWNALKNEYLSTSKSGSDGNRQDSDALTLRHGEHSQSNSTTANASSTVSGVYQLTEVLRFDVSPRWITERWRRVSTVHSVQNLEGFRVPLVTGTSPQDLTGSLTYYFDNQQKVRRVTLHGQTGDERALADLVVQRYGLQREQSLAAGMFVRRWNAEPVHILRVTHAPVMRSANPNAMLHVELELNDLNGSLGLSREMSDALLQDREVRGWVK